MEKLILGAIALACSSGIATAQQWGGAYPDNWQGGPPLPPIGYSQPYAPQPQGYYIQPQVQFVQPQPYATRGYAPTVSYGYQQTSVPAVQGPPGTRCVVAILNGAGRYAGCSHVRINPADIPYLRQKFSAYRPNSGYVLNLPDDDTFRGN